MKITILSHLITMKPLAVLLFFIATLRAFSQQEWFAHDPSRLTVQMNGAHRVNDWCVTADERTLLTWNQREVAVWDVATNRVIKSFNVSHCAGVEAHHIDPDLFYFHFDNDSTLEDCRPILVNWRTGRVLARLPYTLWQAARTIESNNVHHDLIELSRDWKAELTGELNVWQPFLTVPFFASQGIGLLPMSLLIGAGKVEYDFRSMFIGYGTANAGTVSSCPGDSLLLTSGSNPRVINLRRGTLQQQICYDSWLFEHNTNNLEIEYAGLAFPKPKGWGLTRSYHACSGVPYDDDDYTRTRFEADNTLLCGGADNRLTRWHLDGTLLDTIKVGDGAVLDFFQHGDTLVVASLSGLYVGTQTGGFSRIDAATGLHYPESMVDCLAPYGAQGAFLVGLEDDPHPLKVALVGNDSIIAVCEDNLSGRPISRIKVSHDTTYAIVGNAHWLAKVSLKPRLGRLRTLRKPFGVNDKRGGYIKGFEILPSEDIIVGTSTGTLLRIDHKTLQASELQRVHSSSINDVTLSHDGKRFFTSDCGGCIAVWDADSLTNICAILQPRLTKNSDNIFITPDNYYKASPYAYETLHFSKDNRVYGFDQFDLRLNRPDIVMQRLGADCGYVELLHKAWLKRLRRKGLTPEMLSDDLYVPIATIDNADYLTGNTALDADSVQLQLTFSDSRVPLVKAFATLNGVPLLPPQGKDISGQQWHMTLDVPLDNGFNIIEVSALNAQGAESYRTQLKLFTKQRNNAPRLLIAAVGVSRYTQARYNLNYAAKDARDFSTAISRAAQHFAAVDTLVITDSEFNTHALQRIRQFFANSKRGDVALLYYAGHGLLDSELDYYLATHDTDFASPAKASVTYSDFIDVLNASGTTSRYAIIDACHSGTIDKEDYTSTHIQDVALNNATSIIFRGTIDSLQARSKEVETVNTILSTSFYTAEGGGVTVVTAASGMEVAVENADIGNGLFTYCLNKAMTTDALEHYNADNNNDGTLTIEEVIDYATEQTRKLSQGIQTPTLRAINTITPDIILAKNKDK